MLGWTLGVNLYLKENKPGTATNIIQPKLKSMGNSLSAKKWFVCLSLVFLFQETYSQFLKDKINFGKQIMQQKQYDAAISFFTTVIRTEQNAYEAYYYRGECYKNLGKTQEALKDFNITTQINPQYADAYIMKGNIYNGLQNIDQAIKEYTLALQYQKQNASLYRVLGQLTLRKKDYSTSIAYYNETIKLNPNLESNYFERGNAYKATHQYENAIKDYSENIRLAPNSDGSYNNRGVCNMFLGNYAAALHDYDNAIRIDSRFQNTAPLLNSLEPLARLYRFEEVNSRLQKFRDLKKNGYIDSENWAFYKIYLVAITQAITKSDYLEAMDLLDEAESLYTSMVDTDSESEIRKRGYSAILSLKGYILEKVEDYDEAKINYKQALLINEAEPEVVEGLKRIANIEIELAKKDKIAPTLEILEPLINSRSISIGEDKIAGAKQSIRGIASDASGIRTLQINNTEVKVESNGYFEALLPINEGDNNYIINITDNNSNIATETVSIKARGAKINKAVDSTNTSDGNTLTEEPVYHAILIAESEYKDESISSLAGPAKDMAKVYSLLVEKYSFLPENIVQLKSPGRIDLLEEIIKKSKSLKENDNLLIFYAGHGVMINKANNKEEGFLLPSDAKLGLVSSYIKGDELTDAIEASPARHILFIADACFAGTLFRSINNEAPASVSEAYKDKSRKIMSSGNRTVVPDESPFIAYLQTAFLNNKRKFITAEQLLNTFKEAYTDKTRLNLQYNPILGLDQGGHFVFIRKD